MALKDSITALARKIFQNEDYDVARQHAQHADQLLEEHEYAASDYHRDHFLLYLPTEGIA